MKRPLVAAFGFGILSAAAAHAVPVSGEIDAKLDSIMSRSLTAPLVVAETKDDGGELSVVPVPAAGLMLLAGLGGLAVMRRRNRA